MDNLKNINSKQTIVAAFIKAKNEIEQFFLYLQPEEFIGNSKKEWKGSQTLEHLVKIIETIAKSTALPKKVLRKIFGYTEKKSGSFEDIRKRYLKALEEGAEAPAGYYPPERVLLKAEDYRQELLQRWRYENDQLIHNIEKWKENELDEYCVMNPLIGKITVREMLFYALCHNQKHMDDECNHRE
jgi:hypothetical protein